MPPSQLLLDTVAVAFRTGSILVAAAGNERRIGTPVAAPASLNHVLTIAGTDQRNRTASFSSACASGRPRRAGVEIPSAIPLAFNAEGYTSLSGTSCRAARHRRHRLGLTARPQLDNTQVFDLMRWSATDLEGPGFDRDTGYGLLNIPGALARPAPISDRQEPNDDISGARERPLPYGVGADHRRPSDRARRSRPASTEPRIRRTSTASTSHPAASSASRSRPTPSRRRRLEAERDERLRSRQGAHGLTLRHQHEAWPHDGEGLGPQQDEPRALRLSRRVCAAKRPAQRDLHGQRRDRSTVAAT